MSDVSRILLEEGLVTSAGRISGAFRTIGDSKKADQIINDMTAAGFDISEINPFEKYVPVLSSHPRSISPYVGRVQALWMQMREEIIDIFPKPKGKALSKEKTIKIIRDRYSQDAYHFSSEPRWRTQHQLQAARSKR